MIVYLIVFILIVALFLHAKLAPYRSQLTGTYQQMFTFFDKIFNPLFSLMRKIAKPAQVGDGIAVDMSQILLLLILLVLLGLF